MKHTQLEIKELKNTIQDCNINFLIGSGLSQPHLSTLGNIENLLTQLNSENRIKENKKKIIRASLYKKYFDEVIYKNLEIIENNTDSQKVLENYKNFLKSINSTLISRKSTILNKQVNIFTTNIDIYLEKALESINVEYNDGFKGRFNPLFELSNFKKSYFKTSLQYDNVYELPVFNLMKVHGSITWFRDANDNLSFSSNLETIRNIKEIPIAQNKLVLIDNNTDINSLVRLVANKRIANSINKFLLEYEKLLIVNPTKNKFSNTVLDQIYYELLRIYSNELEKENTILIVLGFSFADEHIRDITVRAANSNPTLIIYYFSYNTCPQEYLEKENFINNNLKIIDPPQKKKDDNTTEDKYQYDLYNLNKEVFSKLLNKEIKDESSCL